jgi:hypothetical protein
MHLFRPNRDIFGKVNKFVAKRESDNDGSPSTFLIRSYYQFSLLSSIGKGLEVSGGPGTHHVGPR